MVIPKLVELISQIQDPITGRSLGELGVIDSIDGDASKTQVALSFGYPVDKKLMSERVWQQVSKVVDDLDLDIRWQAPSPKKQTIEGVQHVIAVASGKGGVGKSTTAVNLALALSAQGARVGLLDADIYGPSQPQMLGIGERRPEVVDGNTMLPIEAHGIESMSMGYLVTEKTPMVWRGPMASGALVQMLKQTRWGELDYLLIDMPPGTGDIQLTLSQQVPLSGAAIVTTPQDIALLDAKKAIEMFAKVSVPTLGIIENMSVHICSQCGHHDSIFGEGGGERIAADYQVPFLGGLALDRDIRLQADSGKPTVVANPEGAIAQQYFHIANRLAAELWLNTLAAKPGPTITITDD